MLWCLAVVGAARLDVRRCDPGGRMRIEQGVGGQMMGLSVRGKKSHWDFDRNHRRGIWRFEIHISPDVYEKAHALAEPEGLSVPDWLTNVMIEAIGIDTQQANRITIESG